MSKIDFGQTNFLRPNPDVFADPQGRVVYERPPGIQPRSDPPIAEPAGISDEALRTEMTAFQRVRAEQTEVIRTATAAIRDAEEKIQVARRRLAVAQGC